MRNYSATTFAELAKSLTLFGMLLRSPLTLAAASENENKKYNLVSTRERIAHHLGANVSPQSWRPLPNSIRLPDDHQFARYVIRITIEPEVVCIGAYVKSSVEFGRDKQGNRLSPFGVWLRMRNSLSLSSNEMLKSKSNGDFC